MYRLLRPLLFRLDAETAHRLTVNAAILVSRLPGAPALLRAGVGPGHPSLRQTLWGLAFDNPVGLAAGFDKDGVLAHILPALGFGFLEVGSVTPRPQPGNPRPRLFRLPEDAAIVNRMGFNNEGAAMLAGRLGGLQERPVPIGVNLGKNRDTPVERAAEDYVAAMRAVFGVADYLVVNVSSPNTPGLRTLQHKELLAAMTDAIQGERLRLAAQTGRRVPLLIKVAPELTEAELNDVVRIALQSGIDGLVATNTTTVRDHLHGPHAAETGGLSGRPLREAALRTVATLYRLSAGRLPIVGVGGIASAEDAYAFIRAGASLVQVYTALIYAGPGLVGQLRRGLAALLARDGYSSVSQAVGTGPPALRSA